MNAQSPIQRLRQPQFGRLLSKLLDETSAGDESARTRVPGDVGGLALVFIRPRTTREAPPRAKHSSSRPNINPLNPMRWSFQIARIAGTEVRIHVTFLLFLAWIGFSYYQVGGAAA